MWHDQYYTPDYDEDRAYDEYEYLESLATLMMDVESYDDYFV